MPMQSAREQMIGQQVRAWDVLDERILEALRAVPRELFVPEPYRSLAFADCEIPLAHGKRMLRPMLVGRLLQSVGVRAGERVLEIGTGSGYLAACLAHLGAEVESLELHPELAARARSNLAAYGAASTVQVRTADGMKLNEDARFDLIALTASLPLYQPLFECALRPGGRLFAVIGPGVIQSACLMRADGPGACSVEPLFETCIEPLEGAPRPPAFGF